MFFQTTVNQTRIDAVRAFWDATKAHLPTGLTINVPNVGDSIDEENGHLDGTWSVGTAPSPVVGTGAGAYAGNAGAVIHLLTAGFVAGRRVRGRWFFVPLLGSSYDTSGSLSTAAQTLLDASATALVTAFAGDMVVWARPFPGRDASPGVPAVPARAGSIHPVVDVNVPDLAVSLRSRRT